MSFPPLNQKYAFFACLSKLIGHPEKRSNVILFWMKEFFIFQSSEWAFVWSWKSEVKRWWMHEWMKDGGSWKQDRNGLGQDLLHGEFDGFGGFGHVHGPFEDSILWRLAFWRARLAVSTRKGQSIYPFLSSFFISFGRRVLPSLLVSDLWKDHDYFSFFERVALKVQLDYCKDARPFLMRKKSSRVFLFTSFHQRSIFSFRDSVVIK